MTGATETTTTNPKSTTKGAAIPPANDRGVIQVSHSDGGAGLFSSFDLSPEGFVSHTFSSMHNLSEDREYGENSKCLEVTTIDFFDLTTIPLI